MKFLWMNLFMGLALLASATGARAATPVVEEDDSQFKVLSAIGAVTIYRDERDETSRLKKGDHTDDGDNLTTGAKSEILLRLGTKAYVYLGPHTKIHISRLRTGDKGLQVRLNLLTGDLWCQLDKTPHYLFEVSAKKLVCQCHGTLFETLRQKDAVRVTTFDGPVVTAARGQVKMAKSGEVMQYIDDKFHYKHRLKDSDSTRLAEWKTRLENLLPKTK